MYEVDDIIKARDHLKSEGARVLGDGSPKIGAHGKPVLFLHPRTFAARWSNSNRRDLQRKATPCQFQTSVAVAVYFTMWWIVLFAILPLGVRSLHEEGDTPEGSDPGAPVAPMLLKKGRAHDSGFSRVVWRLSRRNQADGLTTPPQAGQLSGFLPDQSALNGHSSCDRPRSANNGILND